MSMRYAFLTMAGLVLLPEAGHGQSAGLSLGSSSLGAAAVTSLAAFPPGDMPSRDVAVTHSVASSPGSNGKTPLDIVRKCRRAVVAAALPNGVARVDAAGAGPLTPVSDGYVAPIHFSIVYAGPGGREPREATIACVLDKRRRVTAVR